MGAALLGVFIILSTISIHSTLAGKWRVHVSMQAIYIRVFLILAIWERGGIIVFFSLYKEFYCVCTLDIILKQQLFAFLITRLMLFCSLNYARMHCSACFYKRKHLYML